MAASADPILYIFTSLIIGAFIRHLLKNSRIPYTIWLLFYGMVLGLIQIFLENKTNVFSSMLEKTSNIDPHLLLYLFLPPLIFESAYTIDSEIFKRDIVKALILALPGVMFSLFFIGSITKILFPDWMWTECFLLGSILSATDPVSVVALLKTMGAPKSLASAIESESLLNDGTAVVLFIAFHNSVQSMEAKQSEVDVIFSFFWMFFGGISFGLVSSYVILLWISHVFNDAAVEITITLSSAYLVFFIAETQIGVSGVLSVVTLGLCFSRYGVSKISPEVQHFLHEFWHMLEYLANTLVFVLTGQIIIVKNSETTMIDWTNLLLMYLSVNAIRFSMIYLCAPIFNKMENGFTKEEGLIFSWGGLRGAVSLALGLVIKLDETINRTHRNQLMFQVAGIVILTLVINGTSMRHLIRSIGLLDLSDVQYRMRNKALEQLQTRMDDDILELKKRPFYSNSNWKVVKSYTKLPKNYIPTKRSKKSVFNIFSDNKVSPPKNTQGGMEKEVSRRVLKTLRTCFYNQYEDGVVGPKALAILLRGTSKMIEANNSMFLEWKTFEKFTNVSSHGQIMYMPILNKLAMSIMYSKLTLAIDLANGFRYAHESVLKLVNESYLANDNEFLINTLKHLRDEMNEAQNTLYNLHNIFPEIYVSIASRHSARMLLHNQRTSIDHLLHKGLISEEEGIEWTGHIEGNMKQLVLLPRMIHLPSKNDILKEIPWIKSLSSKTFKAVAKYATPAIFSEGEFLVRQNYKGNKVYIISRGVVTILYNYKERSVKVNDVGVGATIGEISLLRGVERSTSVRSQGTVLAFQIDFKNMYKIMSQDIQLENNLWEHACLHMAENILSLIPEYFTMAKSRGKLRRHLTKWELHKVQAIHSPSLDKKSIKGNFFSLKCPLLLLHGYAVRIRNTDRNDYIPLDDYQVFNPISPKNISHSHSKSSFLKDIHRVSVRAPKLCLKASSHEAPCYFQVSQDEQVFVYSDSRIMIGPHENEKLKSSLKFTSEKKNRLDIIMSIPWIKRSGLKVASFLLSVGEDKTFHTGHSFIMDKSVASSFYIIFDGTVSITIEIEHRQIIVGKKGKGCSVGEMAFVTGGLRNARVVAESEPVIALRISYDDLKIATRLFFDANIEENIWFESSIKIATGILHESNIFKDLPIEKLEGILSTWRMVNPSNKYEGDNSKYLPSMFVLTYGSVEIIEKNGNSKTVNYPALINAPLFHRESSILNFGTASRIIGPPDDFVMKDEIEDTNILKTQEDRVSSFASRYNGRASRRTSTGHFVAINPSSFSTFRSVRSNAFFHKKY